MSQLKCRLCHHVFKPQYSKRQLTALEEGFSIMFECPNCRETGHHAREDLAQVAKEKKKCPICGGIGYHC